MFRLHDPTMILQSTAITKKKKNNCNGEDGLDFRNASVSAVE